MKKITSTLLKVFVCFSFIQPGNAIAQKKVIPVTESVITNLKLPAGSKKDSRLLSEVSAKGLLQMEAKKSGKTVNTIEVLYLPKSFTADSLNMSYNKLGWSAKLSATDSNYLWLDKDSKSVLAYFSAGKDKIELYFGETSGAPKQAGSKDSSNHNKNSSAQNTGQVVQKQPEQKPMQNVNQQAAIPGGFAFNTTHFDNGWVSTILPDYVLTTKGNIKVYLSYIEKFNASDFSGTGKEARHHYWDNYVSKYFVTEEMRYNRGGALSDYSDDYIEAWATDRQTNERKYIIMILRIVPYTGTLSIIIASAPDNQELRQQFPKADLKFDNDLLPMYGYNKFAVGQNDLVGKWSSSGGGTMNWYSTTTGQNVGATGAVTADEFEFNKDGTYSSQHKGATGWVGAMNTFQQEYTGRYIVTNWELTINNRFEGKTETYDAWFEAMKGGRVIHLQNKQYSGSQYNLFREK